MDENINRESIETEIFACIDALKKAYREKDKALLEMQYSNLFEISRKKLNQAQKYLCYSALDLANYFFAANILFFGQGIGRYGSANSSISYVKFTDDTFFKHIEEAGITENEQRLLANFSKERRIDLYENSSTGISPNTIFSFKGKFITAYLLNDSEVKKLIREGLPLYYVNYGNPYQDSYEPKNCADSHTCFLMGYLHEVGDEELGFMKNQVLANKFYKLACATTKVSESGNGRIIEQRHVEALLMQADSAKVTYTQNKDTAKLQEVLKLYDHIIQVGDYSGEYSVVYFNSPQYYTASLAAAKLCLYHHEFLLRKHQTEEAANYLGEATKYFMKARLSPIKAERAEAVEQLYILAKKQNDQMSVSKYKKILEDLGADSLCILDQGKAYQQEAIDFLAKEKFLEAQNALQNAVTTFEELLNDPRLDIRLEAVENLYLIAIEQQNEELTEVYKEILTKLKSRFTQYQGKDKGHGKDVIFVKKESETTLITDFFAHGSNNNVPSPPPSAPSNTNSSSSSSSTYTQKQ